MAGILDSKTRIGLLKITNMASGIYRIKNLINQRFYIGSSENLSRRWNTHLHKLRKGIHHNQFLLADFKKCGESTFEFKVLEECSIEQLLLKEQTLLNVYYDTQQKCYNLRPLAESNRGFRHSTETKLKMSLARKGRKPAPQTIEAARLARLGTKLPKNVCQKMSDYQQNRSSEHKRKLSEEAKNKWRNPIYREKMSKAHQKPRFEKRKQIIQFTLNNEKVGTYLGAGEASLVTGVNAGTIRQVALGIKKTAGGFIWKYEK